MSFDYEPYRPHAEALGLAEAEGRKIAASIDNAVQRIVAFQFEADKPAQACAKPAFKCAAVEPDLVQLVLNSLRKIFGAAAS